jgi:nitroimidazol reductase NimA-like FMN-containing flavoprotein (pyridoxamine 5'-phosphate oxidase superfamily)
MKRKQRAPGSTSSNVARSHSGRPVFRELTAAEGRRILSRNHVGRLAYGHRRRVDIEPLHYVFNGGQIVFRTSHGAKFETLLHAPWVAFEVDEVDGPFDWRSVVVHGSVYRLGATGESADVAAYTRALRRLRSLMPAALRAQDPTPARDIILGLYIDTMAGRSAQSSAGRGAR